MSTLLNTAMTTTVASAGDPTTYRDLVQTARFPFGGVQTLVTDTAAGPAERPFRVAGAGAAISFYSERVASSFTLSGNVTCTISGFCSDAAFTGRFRLRLSKITHGGSDIETLLGQTDATADLTTTTTLYTLAALTPVSTVIAANERLIVRLSVIPTGAGGTSFGTGTATHRYNLQGSGITLTETVTFLSNGAKLRLKRTATIGIGTFKDLLEPIGASPFIYANLLTEAGGTELPWTHRTQAGTIAVTDLTAAAIASTSNVTSYTSASFTPVANRLYLLPVVTSFGPVVVTEVTAAAIASTLNVTTYASASFTPVAGRLYLLAVVHSDTAPEATVPTVATTTGLNFVQVGSSIAFNTIASNGNRLTLFRAMKPSGLSAGTYTVTLGDAGTGCAALLAEVTGVATTGTDGADALHAVNISTTAVDAGANPSVTLGTLAQQYHGMFTCFGSSLQTAPTAGSGFTALSHPDYATPTAGLFAEWKIPTGSLAADCTLASSNWAAIAVELVAPAMTEPTITTTTGLAFVQLADSTSAAVSQLFPSARSHNITLFRAMKASGLSAGTYTVNCAEARTGCAALLAEVTGVATFGTDGSAAVRTIAMLAGTTANPSLSGEMIPFFLESYDGVFTCLGSTLATVPTPGTGYTALGDPDYATPTTGLSAQWKATSDNFPACTLAASNWGMIGLELVAAQTAAVIEWLSPRFLAPWYFGSAVHCSGRLLAAAHEEGVGVINSGIRVKLFHRAPDGTETLVYTVSGALELDLAGVDLGWTSTAGTLNQAKGFVEDDRLILRVYLINVGGTMAGGHIASLVYDHNAETGADAYVVLYPATTFKLESDPAGTARITSGLAMGGVGN